MTGAEKTEYDFSLFGEMDSYLFREGNHCRLYEKLGAHVAEHGGKRGTYFAVWAPNAEEVSVTGPFNGWNRTVNYLSSRAWRKGRSTNTPSAPAG